MNSPYAIATLVALGALTSFVLIIAPGLVGAFVSELGLTPQQAGYLISADMAGMGLATLPALLWLNKVNWRKVILPCLVLLAVCHLITANLSSFSELLIIRFVSGLLGGTAMSICLASIGMTDNPDRNFGLWVVGQLCVGTVGLALMPHIVPMWGVKSVFLIAALALVVLAFFFKMIPQGRTAKHIEAANDKTETGYRPLLLACLGISGIYLFYIALSGVWSYLERIGNASGLDAKTIGYHLSVASFMGIVGALSATVLNKRIGRVIPGVAGFITVLISLLLLLGDTSEMAYLMGASLFKFAWTFVLPFLLASIASTDKTGRAIVVANIFMGGGLATGPAVAALLINGTNYMPVIWLGIVGMSICLLLFLPVFSLTKVKTDFSLNG
ncbi:MFS transporter [Dasania marina]|uniref:MFS transporter n=1 Tax=Dasania marina TaxID=471499 RepID=UPI0014613E3C|nr:MFS transporter [Dasania marina]